MPPDPAATRAIGSAGIWRSGRSETNAGISRAVHVRNKCTPPQSDYASRPVPVCHTSQFPTDRIPLRAELLARAAQVLQRTCEGLTASLQLRPRPGPRWPARVYLVHARPKTQAPRRAGSGAPGRTGRARRDRPHTIHREFDAPAGQRWEPDDRAAAAFHRSERIQRLAAGRPSRANPSRLGGTPSSSATRSAPDDERRSR